MKKIAKTATLISLIIFSVLAKANVRDGFYVGAGFGKSYDNYNLTTSYALNSLSIHNNADNENYLGNIFAGWGYTLPSLFFLGGEIGTRFPNHDITINGRPDYLYPYAHFNDKLTVQDYITADALPGYIIGQNLLVYGRAGVVYGDLKFQQTANVFLPPVNASENVWGGRFGVGAMFDIDPTFGIAVDYFYTDYQKMKMYTSLFNTNFTAKTNNNFIGISLLYHV